MDEKSLQELAKDVGLKIFDLAIPVYWTDSVLKMTSLVGEREYPYGFVWGYDKSPVWGEPIPLTPSAKILAQKLAILPR